MAIHNRKIRKFWLYSSRTDFEHAGTKLYVPKMNQLLKQMIGDIFKELFFLFTKFIDGLSFGIIRWVQMYSALIKGEYQIKYQRNYFPILILSLEKIIL